jgi:hypothetical protein
VTPTFSSLSETGKSSTISPAAVRISIVLPLNTDSRPHVIQGGRLGRVKVKNEARIYKDVDKDQGRGEKLKKRIGEL